MGHPYYGHASTAGFILRAGSEWSQGLVKFRVFQYPTRRDCQVNDHLAFGLLLLYSATADQSSFLEDTETGFTLFAGRQPAFAYATGYGIHHYY